MRESNSNHIQNSARKFITIILFSVSIYGNSWAQNLSERRNAIKITFLSWVTGSTKISYERSFTPLQTGELTLGLICAGYDKFRNHPKGFTARYAHKFILINNTNYALNGFYVKPELVWSNFTYDKRDEDYRTKSSMVALFACTGYQWARKRFIVDGYVGIGGSMGRESDTNYHHGFVLWKCFGTYCKNVAMTFAIKLGYSF